MPSIFGEKVKISLFGQSHSAAIGVVIDGLPAGEIIDIDKVRGFLARRAPGKNEFSTSRSEADEPELLSGLVDGYTCGAPLCTVIRNTNVKSGDYSALKDMPRPSHADFPAFVKYGAFHDIRGGGHFSGRLTAPLCFAGAVCAQILERKGIHIAAHIYAIGSVCDDPFDPVSQSFDDLHGKDFPVLCDIAGEKMKAEILLAKDCGDSVGGIIECMATGIPAGLGEPMFSGMENRLAAAVFGIPAVRGIEFGAGFQAAKMRGSEHNDPYFFDDGKILTRTNNHGGVIGGITTGMPIVFRAAFKPTPSIAIAQETVSLSRGENAELAVTGRHDPCIVPRAVPCVEAAAAAVILDSILTG